MRGTESLVFVDTFFLIALIDPRDAHHELAADYVEDFRSHDTRLVTTDAVLLELANFFARPPLRRTAMSWIEAIRAHASWTVVPLDQSLIARAEARYRRFHDKEWSLTDCISMEVMHDRGIRDVATADHHFTQAGFKALLA